MTTGWRKSTFSADNSSCVRIRFDGPHVLFGDTKSTHLGDHDPILRIPATAWSAALPALVRLR